MLNTRKQDTGTSRSKTSFLHLGFRPFFLLASIFAVASIGIWAWLYFRQVDVLADSLPIVSWHAHEMIYGYAMAVVTGFLLTAVRNWTQIQTLSSWSLLALVMIWLTARFIPFLPVPNPIFLMALFDLLYNTLLVVAIGYPLFKARLWKHLSIWSKLLILLIGNAIFYAGLLGWMDDGVTIGLYTGLYMIVSLILLMGRRVIPFFIEKKGAGEKNIVNHQWVDISSLILVLIFLVFEVYWPLPMLAGMTALLLFALHLFRMFGWHHSSIWREPMLWVLYVGYGWIVFAFLLRGLNLFIGMSPMFAIHAFAIGGVGMITFGMMARVSLGHTGRDVYDYPKPVVLVFVLIALSAFTRVIVPMLMPAYYSVVIALSQGFWILAAMVFVYIYAPYLVKPRVDGRYG